MRSSTVQELEQAGAPQHIIDELSESNVIMIRPENWPIVIWFNQVCDLMRYRASDGACLGLDLAQIKSEADMSKRSYTPTQFNGLRTMSKAAASALNKS